MVALPQSDLLLQIEHTSINAAHISGNTSLHYACQNNNIDIVKRLLQHKDINVNSQNEDGKTPLHICMRKRNVEIGNVYFFKLKNINVNAKDDDGKQY